MLINRYCKCLYSFMIQKMLLSFSEAYEEQQVTADVDSLSGVKELYHKTMFCVSGVRTFFFFASLSEEATDKKGPRGAGPGWRRAVWSRLTGQVGPRRPSLSEVSRKWLILSKRVSESFWHCGQTPGILVQTEMYKGHMKSATQEDTLL